MRDVQQIIKAFAIVLAVFIICGIGVALVGAGRLMGYVFDGASGEGDNVEWNEVMIGDEWSFEELVIEVKATNVRIEQGEKFQVLADEEVIGFRRSGMKVYLEEKDFGFFGNWHKVGGELKVVLPRDGDLKKVKVKAGAGTVCAEGLVADEVTLELGAGKAEFVGLVAKNEARIDGGAGYLVIKEAELRNLDLDMGVGKVEIAGRVLGNSDIDAGVGKLEVMLEGKSEDYKLKFSKGLGSITMNGESVGDGETWGNGDSMIKVKGGVGAIEMRVGE